MLIDGFIIKVDYSEQRKFAAEVNKIGVNINQICKRINTTDRVYSEDVAELRKRMDEVGSCFSKPWKRQNIEDLFISEIEM